MYLYSLWLDHILIDERPDVHLSLQWIYDHTEPEWIRMDDITAQDLMLELICQHKDLHQLVAEIEMARRHLTQFPDEQNKLRAESLAWVLKKIQIIFGSE